MPFQRFFFISKIKRVVTKFIDLKAFVFANSQKDSNEIKTKRRKMILKLKKSKW